MNEHVAEPFRSILNDFWETNTELEYAIENNYDLYHMPYAEVKNGEIYREMYTVEPFFTEDVEIECEIDLTDGELF